MPISPTDISGLSVWLKSDYGVYQDASLLVPCTNGTTVYTWENRGSDASDFVQSNAGLRPTFTSSGGAGNKPYITFNSHRLASTIASIALPVTVFLVMKYTSQVAADYNLLLTKSDNTFHIGFTPGTGSAPYIYAGTGGGSYCVALGTSPTVLSLIFDGSSPYSYGWVGSSFTAQPNGVNVGSVAPVSLIFGSDASGAHAIRFDAYEMLIYNSKLSETDRRAVLDYFASEYLFWVNSGTSTLATSPMGPVNHPLNGFSLEGEFYQHGVRKELVDGDDAAPCLALDDPGRFRFRWGVEAGARTIEVRAKQVSNVSGKRPRLIVRANSSIGVSEVVADAASSADWVTISAAVNPTDNGVLWVELWNMDTDNFDSPAFFDSITTA